LALQVFQGWADKAPAGMGAALFRAAAVFEVAPVDVGLFQVVLVLVAAVMVPEIPFYYYFKLKIYL
jgi:hypothetical protein